jgi:hypothetical protein
MEDLKKVFAELDNTTLIKHHEEAVDLKLSVL